MGVARASRFLSLPTSHNKSQAMKTRYRNTVLDQSDNAKLDVLCVGVCVALFLVCFLVTNPISQTCAFDDWSYTWTALHYAQSGKLLYNGWATTMLVGQVIWGALFVKLFGANIMVLRLSTLPLATACVPLVYGCGRQVGLSRRLACFAALSWCFPRCFSPWPHRL